MRKFFSTLSFVGALGSAAASLYLYLTLKWVCVEGGWSQVFLLTAAMAAVPVTFALALLTWRSQHWPAAAYKVALWATFLAAIAAATATATVAVTVFHGGPAATKGGAWADVAQCLGRQRFCSSGHQLSSCCSRPTGCGPFSPTPGADCPLWRPAEDRLCYGCFACRVAVRRMAKRRSTVPMVLLGSSLLLLLLAVIVHTVADCKGKCPLPPRPVTTVVTTTTRTTDN